MNADLKPIWEKVCLFAEHILLLEHLDFLWRSTSLPVEDSLTRMKPHRRPRPRLGEDQHRLV